jgi:hypothetical protein
MTQPPGAQPPPADAGNPWQTPPGGGSPYPPHQPPTPPHQPPPSYEPPTYQPAPQPPYHPAPPTYEPAPPTAGFPQPGYGPPPGSAPPFPGSAPPFPGSAPPFPGSAPPGSFPPYYAPQPAPRRRGPLIAVIVLVVLIVLAGGGLAIAYLLHRNADGVGRNSASSAAQGFLEAVYVQQDAKKAAPFVCSAARDTKKLNAKINEIKQQDQQYEGPKYTWSDLATVSSTKNHAVISTTVTLTTANVQKATEKLKLTVVKSNGWFVCDVQQQS